MLKSFLPLSAVILFAFAPMLSAANKSQETTPEATPATRNYPGGHSHESRETDRRVAGKGEESLSNRLYDVPRR